MTSPSDQSRVYSTWWLCIFPPSCNSTIELLSGQVRGATGWLPGVTPSAHRNVCACACMPGHVLQQRPLPRSERENLKKTGTAVCVGKPASPPHTEEKTKQNSRCALRVQMWKV